MWASLRERCAWGARLLQAVLAAAVLGLVRLFALCLGRWRMATLLRSISLPHLQEHRGRTLLTVAGVALGVAVLVAVSTMNRAILHSIRATVSDLSGGTDLQVQAGSSGFDEALLEQARNVAGVRAARPVLEQTVRMSSGKGEERVLVLGLDLLSAGDGFLGDRATHQVDRVKNDPIAFLNAANHILLSRPLARRMTGGQLLVRTPRGLERFQSWGVFDGGELGSAFGGALALMDYVAMQVAFERGHNIDRIDIELTAGADAEDTARSLKARLGPAFFVGRPDNRAQKASTLVASLSSGLTMASLVAVLVSMFLIFSTMAIGVTQRRREIGVLRALGMTRSELITLFALEAALLGCAGSTLGIGLGVLMAHATIGALEETVSELFVQVSVSELDLGLVLLLVCWTVGVVASLVAGALPAALAARVEPTEALAAGRHMAAGKPQRRLTRDVAALCLALLAWLLLRAPFLGGPALSAALACATTVLAMTFWMPRLVRAVHALARLPLRFSRMHDLRLANDSLLRELDRVSITASALMVGVAMSLSFASFVDSFTTSTLTWVDQMLPADLWITSAARMGGGRSVPMTDGLYHDLKGLPGVAWVERVRMVDVDVKGLRPKLIASDVEALGRRARLMVLTGDADDAKRALLRGEALISENMARRLALEPGDHIELAAASGALSLRVAGVIVDYTSDQGSLLVSRATFVAHFRDTRVDSYKVYLERGVASESVRRAIVDRYGERWDLTVLTQREFREQVRALLAQTFGLMHGLELVAVVIAVLGVVNATFANVLDRAREYGFLRAVGMLRSQLMRMVVLEATLLGIAGAIAGVIAGLAIGYVLLAHINVTQTGWHLPYHPTVLSALAAAMPVIAAAAVAGWYPARLAAASPIANALAYE